MEDILKDDETLTSYLLRDVPLTESVVHQLVHSQIRPEQVNWFGLLKLYDPEISKINIGIICHLFFVCPFHTILQNTVCVLMSF